VTGNMGPVRPGDDRFVGPARSRADESGQIVPALQGHAWTPTSLRERVSRLIEIGDAAAALEAATLLIQESDRILAEAAGEFSQTRRIARQVSTAQAHVEAQRERLTYDEHNLSDAVTGLAHRRASLEDLETELMAEKQALDFREQSLKVRESELIAREQALEGRMTQKRGRRVQADAVPAQAFFDSGPLELRPDPLTAHSVREFLECLTRFRIYAGNRSVRQISDCCGGLISSSTVGNVLRGGTLPDRLEVVDAIVLGCGGSPDDRADFAHAWRRLAMSQFDYEATRTDIPPVRD
jgi:hypothetical protein